MYIYFCLCILIMLFKWPLSIYLSIYIYILYMNISRYLKEVYLCWMLVYRWLLNITDLQDLNPWHRITWQYLMMELEVQFKILADICQTLQITYHKEKIYYLTVMSLYDFFCPFLAICVLTSLIYKIEIYKRPVCCKNFRKNI